MFTSYSVPLWLLAILVFLAVIAVLDRILKPGVRWYFQRRVNTAIDELNARLDTRIQPFKLARKQSLIDQLMYDPQIIAAAEEESTTSGEPVQVVMKKAERYAREIVPSFSPLAYFGVGTRLTKWLSELLYRVRLGYLDDEKLTNIDPNASVVFVMNHRSNMDYILVTYLASSRTTLSYAVGEWARIWGLQSLIRAMGAYFIRRSSNNELYRRVLARYVAMATREGVTQAVFPEGGLSRDGNLQSPKLGLLSYMLSDFDPAHGRDIVFVPVGINYDRVIEDRVLTKNLERENSGRDFSVNIPKSIRFLGTMLGRRFKGRLYRLGYACVSFGTPLSLAEHIKSSKVDYASMAMSTRNKFLSKLGEQLIEKVGDVVPALPVSLVAYAFRDSGMDRELNELELKSRVADLIADLTDKGHHVHIPDADLDYAVSTGLRMLTLRHILIDEGDGTFKPNQLEKILIDYYANSIAHLF